MSAAKPLAAYVISYALTYLVSMFLALYPSPFWGGEALYSFLFLLATALPGLCVAALLRKKMGWSIAAVLGFASFALVVPMIEFSKFMFGSVGGTSWWGLFVTYLAVNFAGLYALGRALVSLGQKWHRADA